MTTIVGVQEADRCIIGADSQTTSGDRPYTSKHTPKITIIGEYMIAAAGQGLATDVLMHHWKPPSMRTSATEYLHMVRDVVPSIRAAFNKHEVTFTGDESFQALIAMHGQLFEIASDYTVLVRDDGYYAIGSGASYALGALHMGATVEEALEVAELNDIYTSGPMVVRTMRHYT